MAERNVEVTTDQGPLFFWASDTLPEDEVESAVWRLVAGGHPGIVIESVTFGELVN